MALRNSSSSSGQSRQIQHLSPEVLALIFECLSDIDICSHRNSRLVCRRFDAVAVPVLFRSVDVNAVLGRGDAVQQLPQVVKHMERYTQHMTVNSNLDPVRVRKLLSVPQRLLRVTWRYVDGEAITAPPGLLRELVKKEILSPNTIRLYIENFDLHRIRDSSANFDVHAIPTEMLVSLKLCRPERPLYAAMPVLKHLLAQSHHLQAFHYQDRGQGTSFSFQQQDRLPPLKDLALRSYDWSHSAKDVQNHWDFSQITSLRLISVPVFNFLASVELAWFAGLRVLQVEDWSAHLPDKRREATERLNALVKTHVVGPLEELDVNCHVELFPVDAVLRHGRTLSIFRFRDYVGFGDELVRCPCLGVGDVDALAEGLKHVHTLEMDLDIASPDYPAILESIGRFRSLHTLTLHVQTRLSSLQPVPRGHDPDYDLAMYIFQTLVQPRQQQQQTTSHISWRCVTINVGGWKRYLVRRLDAAWRAQNERGLFAERCFVMERGPGDERYDVREEKCVELSSRNTTPDLT